MIRHIPAIWAVEPSTDATNDPALRAAMDTAAWTVSLTWATWYLFAAAVVAAYVAFRTWIDTKNQLGESRAQTKEACRQADAAKEQLDRSAEADEQSEARRLRRGCVAIADGIWICVSATGTRGPSTTYKLNFWPKPSRRAVRAS
jgi:hypothetical protein